MKITNVVCSAGRTGFYFDDQRAIKGGAGHDGVFYIGAPVTEGFRAVRQAGESISVMIVLEDGQVAYGDCAAVQYSGAGGRDPLFLAEDFIPVIENYIKPELVGKEADNFRELCAMMEAITGMKSSAKNSGSRPPAPEYCTAAQSPKAIWPSSRTSITEMDSPA